MATKPKLIEAAGFAENTETGNVGVLLVIEHSDPRIAEAAASYLLEVVGPAMERGLPVIETITEAFDKAGAKAEAAEADKAAERINEAEPTAEAVTEASATIDRLMESVRNANPGSANKQ